MFAQQTGSKPLVALVAVTTFMRFMVQNVNQKIELHTRLTMSLQPFLFIILTC